MTVRLVAVSSALTFPRCSPVSRNVNKQLLGEAPIQVTCKTLRMNVRFSVEVYRGTTTVLDIKRQLTWRSEEVFNTEHVDTAEMKVVLNGRILADSYTFGDDFDPKSFLVVVVTRRRTT